MKRILIQRSVIRIVMCLKLMMVFSVVFLCCEEADSPVEEKKVRIYSDHAVNWGKREHGSEYTADEAAEDFGNITGWNKGNTTIDKGAMVVRLKGGTFGSSRGQTALVDIPDREQYRVEYKIKFHQDFDWGMGGKVGFGFKIGEGNTGGDKADDGNGGSARIMWSTNNPAGEAVLVPYIYYKDMSGQYGNSFGKRYPEKGSLAMGVWHTVTMTVKSNKGSNKDGHLTIIVNGTTLVDMDIRWTTNDEMRLINTLAIGTFRGGDTASWAVSSDGLVYYDDVSWTDDIN